MIWGRKLLTNYTRDYTGIRNLQEQELIEN